MITSSVLKRPLGSATLSGLGISLLDLGGHIVRELRLRRAIRDVQELDDAILHDIGLTRDSVESAVRYGRGRPQNSYL